VQNLRNGAQPLATDGRASTLRGGLLSIPTMMCTCCTAPVAVGLRKRGASVGASMAFWLGNPALNPAVLACSFFVLGWEWTVLRAAAGVLLILGVTAMSRYRPAVVGTPAAEDAQLAARAESRQIGVLPAHAAPNCPGSTTSSRSANPTCGTCRRHYSAVMVDPRRLVPRTDAVLADPAVAAASRRLGPMLVKRAVTRAQASVRTGALTPEDLTPTVLAMLPATAASLHPVLNATGVLLHTNLGRAPLSAAAVDALIAAAGTTDVELDLATGQRGRRGHGTVDALLAAVPSAAAAHVTNNGAAALVLAATALAAGREIIIARGEMVEIGDGFRLPELLVSTGARLREVGTTNRVTRADYAAAIGPDTGFILKVHPSNFVITGFTSTVDVSRLGDLGVPVVADIGSGLLQPHPLLPDEPDATSMLSSGADLVTASGDKLLGGPQAGLLLGDTELVHTLRRHPLARALRVDKLTLAALEATLRGPSTPTARALQTRPEDLTARANTLATQLRSAGLDALTVPTQSTVGGGGAPGVQLPSAAVSLPPDYAPRLRAARTPVLGRLERGRCLLDLRAISPESDADLLHAVQHC